MARTLDTNHGPLAHKHTLWSDIDLDGTVYDIDLHGGVRGQVSTTDTAKAAVYIPEDKAADVDVSDVESGLWEVLDEDRAGLSLSFVDGGQKCWVLNIPECAASVQFVVDEIIYPFFDYIDTTCTK